ncbi:MAG: recombinase family protein [Eubacteriales bacterium]|nr:recombinase family protein [Eubacteriales bacterium]
MAEITIIEATNPICAGKRRVAAYCRVSSDSADQLNSFITQVKYYTEYIGKNPEWILADIYADEGLSGTKTDKRDEFNRLMQDCRKGKIDLILVKSVSRFARNTIDCLTAIRELKQLGIVVRFEKEDLDTSKVGSEMSISCNGTLAQEESMSISKNVRWGTRKRMENGTFIAGCAPFGFRLIKGSLVICEEEAEIVQKIFRQYLDGNGKAAIAKMLNQDDRARQMRSWNASGIEYIIRNEKYCGDTLMQKGFTTETLPFKFKRNAGQLPQYYVENTHVSIITSAMFEQAQRIMRERVQCNRKPNGNYPLSRKIHCQCGVIYRRLMINGNAYWACRAKEHGADGEHSIRIPEEALYQTFIRMFNKLRLHYKDLLLPLISRLESIKENDSKKNNQVFTIDKRIAELNRQNLVLAELKAKGYMDSADYLFQSDAANKEVNKLRAQRAKLLKENDDCTISQLYGLLNAVQNIKTAVICFDSGIFAEIVEAIYPQKEDCVVFKLYGGLMLRERMLDR